MSPRRKFSVEAQPSLRRSRTEPAQGSSRRRGSGEHRSGCCVREVSAVHRAHDGASGQATQANRSFRCCGNGMKTCGPVPGRTAASSDSSESLAQKRGRSGRLLLVIEAPVAGGRAMLREVLALQSSEHAAAGRGDGDLLVVRDDRRDPLGDGEEPPRRVGAIDEDLVHQRLGLGLVLRSRGDAGNRDVHMPGPSSRMVTRPNQLSPCAGQPYLGLLGTEPAVSQPVDQPFGVIRQSFSGVAGPAHDRDLTASLPECPPPSLGLFARHTSSGG